MWEQLHLTCPNRRDVGCAAVATGRKLYVFGGSNVGAEGPQEGLSGDRLDLDSLEGEPLAAMPAIHDYFPQAVDTDESIYLFGGCKAGAASKFEPHGSRQWKTLPGIGEDAEGGSCYAARPGGSDGHGCSGSRGDIAGNGDGTGHQATVR